MSSRTDVTIVGGGPVGLVMSVVLSALRVRNTIIERDRSVYGLPRAIVMDAEVRHSLERLGLGPQLARVLEPMRAADFVDATGLRLMGIDLSEISLFGGAAVSKHFQPMLDAMLREEVQERGAEALFGREVVAHHQTTDGVVLRLDDGSTLESQYLIACDGASSRTRKSEEMILDDLGFDQDWLVVDLELVDRPTSGLPDVTRQVCDPARPTTLVSGFGNYYRFEFQLQPGESPASMSEDDAVWDLLSRWLVPSQARIVRRAAYRFHAVVAQTLRHRRVLLAGDSAHQMPPFMGQGLNSGMRDALNLGWKLAYVLRNWCGESLLDTYGLERIPHVRSAVRQSVDTGRLIDQLAGRTSHGVGSDAGYGGTHRYEALSSGVVFEGSEHVGKPHPLWHRVAVTTHDEFVVLHSCDVPSEVSIRRIPLSMTAADQILTLGHDCVVVRPDGYVAATSTANDLDRALRALETALVVVD